MNNSIYPILPLRRMVIFPDQITKLSLARKKSISASKVAFANGKNILLVPQMNYDIKDVKKNPVYYSVGVLAAVYDLVEENGIYNIFASGIRRVLVKNVVRGDSYDEAEAEPFIEKDLDAVDVRLLQQRLVDILSNKALKEDTFMAEVEFDTDIEKMSAYDLAMQTCAHMPYEEALNQLSEPSLVSIYENILVFINKEIEIAKVDRRINLKIRSSFEAAQRESYLREKMRVIQKELGVGEESAALDEKIKALPIAEEHIQKLLKDSERLSQMSQSSAEYTLLRTYLDFVVDLPWGVYTEDSTDLKQAKEILDRDHFGLEKIKDRILEFLAVHSMSKNHKEPILCFVGPPGVGKTTIVKSIADSLDRAYVRMSLGGVHDEAEIRGHRKTYIGAMPGRIVSTVKQSGTMNPVFLLDEVDKLAKDYRGDPSAALLEVLDPEMNNTFRDNYLEIPFDLKDVIFITTANAMDTIPLPLLDRMEVIEMRGYTSQEKFEIAKRHLIKKQLENCGLKAEQAQIGEGVIEEVIDSYTLEAGVRQLEKCIAQIMRRICRKIVETGVETVSVTLDNLAEFLGNPKYSKNKKIEQSEVGIATGLAWTQYGGTLLDIEVSLMEGKGEILLTGSLGDVLKESATAAISYLKSHTAELNIDPELFKTKDIHVHIPEGATPKDGPSAGITLATSIYSALCGKKVRNDISMTGEITLRGKVLPIGGLKEKLLASHRAHIYEVIVPYENKKDLSEIPECILNEVKVNFVKDVGEVFDLAIIQ